MIFHVFLQFKKKKKRKRNKEIKKKRKKKEKRKEKKEKRNKKKRLSYCILFCFSLFLKYSTRRFPKPYFIENLKILQEGPEHHIIQKVQNKRDFPNPTSSSI